MVVYALGEAGKPASSGRSVVEVVDLPFHGAHLLTQGLNLRPRVRLCGLHAGKLAAQKADLLLLLVQAHLHGVHLAIDAAGQNERSQKQWKDIRLFHRITLKERIWTIKIRPLPRELKSAGAPPAEQHIGHAAEDGNKHAGEHPQHPLKRRFKGMAEGVPDTP